MGWFAIAFIGGFLAFWAWRKWLGLPDERRQAWWPLIGFVIIALIVVAIWYVCSHSLAITVDRIGHGYVARILVGLVLGIATGYVIEQRAMVHAARLGALDAAANRQRAAAVSGKSVDAADGVGAMGLTGLLSLAGMIVLFAIAAPHLDNWLSRLTGFKSSFVELQLSTSTTHPVAVAEGTQKLYDKLSLAALSAYSDRIKKHVEYMERFELPALRSSLTSKTSVALSATRNEIAKTQALVRSSKELIPIFEEFISPIAGCVQAAINNGMSIDYVRQIIRPIANTLAQIIFIADKLKGNPDSLLARELDRLHQRFWASAVELPHAVAGFLHQDQDKLHQDKFECYHARWLITGGSPGPEFPRIQDYDKLPYLHVAAALLMSFMTEEDVALRILKNAESKIDFRDYGFLFLAGQISYYQMQRTDVSYFRYLDELHKTAAAHQEVIQEMLAKTAGQCTGVVCADLAARNRDLILRERHAELTALNAKAYYLAEDLARDIKVAAAYQARLEEYAKQLLQAVEKGEFPVAKYNLLDTYAYASMVLETRKSNPDVNRFKQLVRIFETVLENDPSDPKTLRTHLASARQLAGQ